uniref:Uncharacterized protein n=1 Tax=Arundo donax TaxID=35708 RepID=A0A0A9ANE7_ARUDO
MSYHRCPILQKLPPCLDLAGKNLPWTEIFAQPRHLPPPRIN